MANELEMLKRIESLRKPKPWAESRLKRLKDLDRDARAVGRMLLGCPEDKDAHAGGERAQRLRAAALQKLRTLDDAALLRLGRALFPQFPDTFEAAWKLHERLPIQAGPTRKPFRTPGRPDLLREARIMFLGQLMQWLEGLEQDLAWVAAHAAHVAYWSGAEQVGTLLAAAIDRGGRESQQIQEILRASAEGTHEVGQMGRHVTIAFLCSQNRDCWEYVEKLLLAAQRQEGLRQAILESVDFSHPDAFRRMLRVILDNNLVRFSATVRAANVWLGMPLDSQSVRYVSDTLESLAALLDDEAARAKALAGDEPDKTFLALWAIAFDDAPAAVKPAVKLLQHKQVEKRFVGVHTLGMLDLPESREHVRSAIDDADLRVATAAALIAHRALNDQMNQAMLDEIQQSGYAGAGGFGRAQDRARLSLPSGTGDLFERLERLYNRLPDKARESKPLVWPWIKPDLERRSIANALILALGQRPRAAVLPYLGAMSPEARKWVADLLGAERELDAASRDALLELVGDAAGGVREAAVKAMTQRKLAVADLPRIEPLLRRKGNDLRRGVLGLILSLPDADVLACAERLAASKSQPQRLAGLELLRQLKEAGRAVDQSRSAASQYGAARKSLERAELVYLDQLAQPDEIRASLDDALGLMDPARRTPPTQPRPTAVKLHSPASRKLIELIDAAVHAHREEPVEVRKYGMDQEPQLLGTATWGIPEPFTRGHKSGAWTKRPLEELLLRDVWMEAWTNRPAAARDADGFDAARALVVMSSVAHYDKYHRTGWRGAVTRGLLGDPPKVRYPAVVADVMQWFVAYETPPSANLADFALDGFESLLAAIPRERLCEAAEWRGLAFRQLIAALCILTRELRAIAADRGQWTPGHTRRLYGLQRWIDEPLQAPAAPPRGVQKIIAAVRGAASKALKAAGAAGAKDGPIRRARVDWNDATLAFDAGAANEHDLLDNLLGPRNPGDRWSEEDFDALSAASTRLRQGDLSPDAAAIVQRAVDRIIEVELARGESETPATKPALALNYAGGMDVLARVLQAIGRDPKLQRTHSWGEASKGKSAVFSHLIRVTTPGPDDSPERFAQAIRAAGIAENALLAVAFYAPQWARHVQQALDWDVLAEAVWWFHAHTKDNQWRVDEEIRESWNAEIRKLTPLALEDLVEGAVDVDWFRRVHGALGDNRWKRLDEFAKYASGSGGHKRAQLFAQSMLGQVAQADLVKEIESKRKQDAVRALGLVPLGRSRKGDVLERYRIIQEFVRTCRQFGSQRQASEKLAARIGQENLARTAGYPDPIRLQWAMEALATADLAKGPVTVKAGDVTVQLAIDNDGRPEVSARRGDKPLKSIPPAVKKLEVVQALTERKTDLRRSASRMRQSLELAMCRGDQFSGDELRELMGNVMLRPMLERLAFAGDGILGYPVDGGQGLRDHAGGIEPVQRTESLRLAHPVDLLATKQWSAWQRDCFAAERVQPFKQVFRELYVLTEQERSDRHFSRRYAGQQVNPRQAMSLLGSRGWVAAPEQGVFRVFHDEKLTAWIEFMEHFHTPAEVEGLTIERIEFARRSAIERLALPDVPPRVFSEIMRDVDLIVSVAHRGGVDPEASAGTVELRAALLRETVQLLNLTNVTIKPPHVHIRGERGEYSVHLGSATTHMLPGGMLFIVPVHSQHRGRIFLPFADDDPKTAEVVSKVLLLARDAEIKDPNLLDQIRARA